MVILEVYIHSKIKLQRILWYPNRWPENSIWKNNRQRLTQDCQKVQFGVSWDHELLRVIHVPDDYSKRTYGKDVME